MNLIDNAIRLAAFDWLKIQSEIHIDGIPWSVLLNGFSYNGERVTLIGAKGIWKPQQMELPISITTSHGGPYDDSEIEVGKLLKYRYRGENPYHPDNVGLRNAMKDQVPLIYFLSTRKGFYVAEWPVYIVCDNIEGLNFIVDIKGNKFENADEFNFAESNTNYPMLEKAYGTSQIMVRLHQKTFRERVLQAYKCQCSLCKLKHRELLDAAHIISDRQDNGDPVVQNGISLCKIHHAAFDSNIIGITPDYSIMVRKDILKEIDGPMLKFGIQELNGNKLILPERKDYWPDRDRLNERFQNFLVA
jgi:putative restriction endonuclease